MRPKARPDTWRGLTEAHCEMALAHGGGRWYALALRSLRAERREIERELGIGP